MINITDTSTSTSVWTKSGFTMVTPVRGFPAGYMDIQVTALSGSIVFAYDGSIVFAYDGSIVFAYDGSTVTAFRRVSP
jgi:hypothetical protein